MTEPGTHDLPILRELGQDLARAFHAKEAAARRTVPRRLRPLLRRGALLAVAAGTLTAVIVSAQSGGPPAASASAVLTQAAATAERHAVPFPADNQYYHLRYLVRGVAVIRAHPDQLLRLAALRSAQTASVTLEGQVWSSATRPGTATTRLVSIGFPTAAARQLWERLGRPALVPPEVTSTLSAPGHGTYLLGNLSLTRRQLLAVSTDPHALYARLYEAGGSAAEVFTEIGDTLRNRPLPTSLRSALYRTLALVPGIRLFGPVRDDVGRQGVGVGLAGDGVEHELIVAPASAEMLGERTIVAPGTSRHSALPTGTVISSTTYLERSVANSAPPLP